MPELQALYVYHSFTILVYSEVSGPRVLTCVSLWCEILIIVFTLCALVNTLC